MLCQRDDQIYFLHNDIQWTSRKFYIHHCHFRNNTNFSEAKYAVMLYYTGQLGASSVTLWSKIPHNCYIPGLYPAIFALCDLPSLSPNFPSVLCCAVQQKTRIENSKRRLAKLTLTLVNFWYHLSGRSQKMVGAPMTFQKILK